MCTCWAAQPIPSSKAAGHQPGQQPWGSAPHHSLCLSFPSAVKRIQQGRAPGTLSPAVMRREMSNGDNDSKRLIGRETLAQERHSGIPGIISALSTLAIGTLSCWHKMTAGHGAQGPLVATSQEMTPICTGR